MTHFTSSASPKHPCSCGTLLCQTPHLVRTALTHARRLTCLREEEQAALTAVSTFHALARARSQCLAVWQQRHAEHGDGRLVNQMRGVPQRRQALTSWQRDWGQQARFSHGLLQQEESWKQRRLAQLGQHLKGVREQQQREEQTLDRLSRQFAQSFRAGCYGSLLKELQTCVTELKDQMIQLEAEVATLTQSMSPLYGRFLRREQELRERWQAVQQDQGQARVVLVGLFKWSAYVFGNIGQPTQFSTHRLEQQAIFQERLYEIFCMHQENYLWYSLEEWELNTLHRFKLNQLGALSAQVKHLEAVHMRWCTSQKKVINTQPRTLILQSLFL